MSDKASTVNQTPDLRRSNSEVRRMERLQETRRFYGLDKSDSGPARQEPIAEAQSSELRPFFDRKLSPVGLPTTMTREPSLVRVGSSTSAPLGASSTSPAASTPFSQTVRSISAMSVESSGRPISSFDRPGPAINSISMPSLPAQVHAPAETLRPSSRMTASRQSSRSTLNGSQTSLRSNPSRSFHVALTPDEMGRTENESDGSSTLVDQPQPVPRRPLRSRLVDSIHRLSITSGDDADRRNSHFARQQDYYSFAHDRTHRLSESTVRPEPLIAVPEAPSSTAVRVPPLVAQDTRLEQDRFWHNRTRLPRWSSGSPDPRRPSRS